MLLLFSTPIQCLFLFKFFHGLFIISSLSLFPVSQSFNQSLVPSSSLCVLSFPTRHQHEESLQELHHSGPEGGVQEQCAQSCQRDVQCERQASATQHPLIVQVGVVGSYALTKCSDLSCGLGCKSCIFETFLYVQFVSRFSIKSFFCIFSPYMYKINFQLNYITVFCTGAIKFNIVNDDCCLNLSHHVIYLS